MGKPNQKTIIITDPPYGMDLDTDFAKIHKGHLSSTNGKHEKVIGDDKQFKYRDFEYLNADEEFWWGADYYIDTLPNYGKDGSWLVWDKVCGRFKGRIGNEFELCWSKKKHKRVVAPFEWVGFNSLDTKKRVHPTQKPVDLIAKIITDSSKQDDIVLDLFLGSGSTLIAAEKTGRICYGMELSEKYVDVIIKRYIDYTGGEAVRLNDGKKYGEIQV